MPVKGASVSFIYETGEVASAMTDDTGKFNMTTGGREGAPIGKAKVSITKISGGAPPKPPEQLKPEDMIKMSGGGSREGMQTRKDQLPEKYASPGSSGFEADVSATTSNEFTFPMSDS